MIKKIFAVLILVTITLMPIASFAKDSNENYLTRGEACKFLMNTLGEERISHVKLGKSFEDTEEEIYLKARKLGLISGFKNNDFLPDKPLTVEAYIGMLKKVVDLLEPNVIYDNTKIKKLENLESFENYYWYAINQLSSIDAFQGVGKLSPKSYISEKQALGLMSKALSAVGKAPKAQPGVMGGKHPKTILYHHIGYSNDPEYKYMFVSPEKFEEQIKYLSEQGYMFLFPEELNYSKAGQKSIVITFDDGYYDNYKVAMPILKKYNAKATVYVFTDGINTQGFCSEDQLVEMTRSGVFRIGSHTASHALLSCISLGKVDEELKNSKKIIGQITGREATSFCYPGGDFNENSINLVKKYYKTGMAVQPVKDYNIYKMPRLNIVESFNLKSFAKELKKNKGE